MSISFAKLNIFIILTFSNLWIGRIAFAGDQVADIAVVGAGPAGLGVAITLGENGQNVILLEANRKPTPGARYNSQFGAGIKNAGLIYQFGEDGHYGKRTAEKFRELNIPLVENGATMVSTEAAEAHILDRAGNVRTTEAEMKWREPGLRFTSPSSSGLVAAYYQPQAMRANPELAMARLWEDAESKGVAIQSETNITGLEYLSDEKIYRLTTENPHREFLAKQVVISAGPHTATLLAQLGITLKMKKITGIILKTRPFPKPLFNGIIYSGASAASWYLDSLDSTHSHLNVTHLEGEMKKLTQHLYMRVDDQNCVYIGGPRIQRVDGLSDQAIASTYPKGWVRAMMDTLEYVNSFSKFPIKSSDIASRWTGVMAFEELPFTSPAVDPHRYPGLFRTRLLASHGFMHGFAVGEELALDILENQKR